MAETGREDIVSWVESTAPIDRVVSIVLGTDEPMTVAEIADAAEVTVEDVEQYASTLTSLGVLQQTVTDEGKVYRPDAVYLRCMEMQRLLGTRNRLELRAYRDQLIEEIVQIRGEWREELGGEPPVESFPAALRDAAEAVAETETSVSMKKDASVIESVVYRLDVVDELLENHEAYEGYERTDVVSTHT